MSQKLNIKTKNLISLEVLLIPIQKKPNIIKSSTYTDSNLCIIEQENNKHHCLGCVVS